MNDAPQGHETPDLYAAHAWDCAAAMALTDDERERCLRGRTEALGRYAASAREA